MTKKIDPTPETLGAILQAIDDGVITASIKDVINCNKNCYAVKDTKTGKIAISVSGGIFHLTPDQISILFIIR